MATAKQGTSQELDGICPEWATNIPKVLLTSAEIQSRVKSLAMQISSDYAGKEILCVGVFGGALMLVSDLLRHLTVPYKVDSIWFSYCGTTSVKTYNEASAMTSESCNLKKSLSLDPAGAHVLVIDELVATGNTLQWISNHFATQKCASFKICCLLHKKAWRTASNRSLILDYAGFECPDEFVVGYGMDYAEYYRCLPFIGILDSRAYLN